MKEPCSACMSPKSSHSCAHCGAVLCKQCLEYVDTHSFSFMSRVPSELMLANYCPNCYLNQVLPAKSRYEQTMEKAKDVYFLTKAYPGYIHVLQRHTKKVTVDVCDDRRETILRLAFFAAELGFNAIIEAEVESAKVRLGKYQTSTWQGKAMPANINAEQLERSSLRRI